MNGTITKKIFRKLFFVYTVILILISVLPINSSGSVINNTFVISIRLDYLLHCVIFIPWVFLLQKFTLLNIRGFSKKTLIWVFISISFTLVLEAIQYFLPYRAFNINDLLANGLGVVLGFVILLFYTWAGIPFKGLRGCERLLISG